MNYQFKFLSIACLITAMLFSACKKTEYSFGQINTPVGLGITTTIQGATPTNPSGDGSGNVSIITSADKALSYRINYGDGKEEMVPAGVVNHKYGVPGTNTYIITVTAVGTGGALTTLSKEITVFVAFEIPASILQNLTQGTSKVWKVDQDAPGHFGVGPNNEFAPIWYAASPNSREACAYDDELTFTKTGANNVQLSIDNKGQSFSIGASSAFYGFGGGDACFDISTTGSKALIFLAANSGSNAANSTGIQFEVPGNGILSFGTGGKSYEIISLSETQLQVRNIGIDGNAWYQIFKPK